MILDGRPGFGHMERSASKIDKEIHRRAIGALRHFKEHGDSRFLSELVKEFPRSNRQKAFIRWVRAFTQLEWVPRLARFRGATGRDEIDVVAASVKPHWEYKEWRHPRRHVSGSAFDGDKFVESVVEELRANIAAVSFESLTHLEQQVALMMSKKRRHREFEKNG